MLHEIFKGMDNSAEQINENFNKIKPESGVDYIKHGGIVFANRVYSMDRVANPYFTVDFSIEFEDIYAIIINTTTEIIEDMRDADKLMGQKAYNLDNRIRVAGPSTNVSWVGSGPLELSITVIGTPKGGDV